MERNTTEAANLAEHKKTRKEKVENRLLLKRHRSRSRSQSPSRRQPKCYFCKRKGHLRTDCKKYRKAQRKAQEESSSGSEMSSESEDNRKKKKKTSKRSKGGKEESATFAWQVNSPLLNNGSI